MVVPHELRCTIVGIGGEAAVEHAVVVFLFRGELAVGMVAPIGAVDVSVHIGRFTVQFAIVVPSFFCSYAIAQAIDHGVALFSIGMIIGPFAMALAVDEFSFHFLATVCIGPKRLAVQDHVH